jgi:hypothetical protein
MCSSGGIMAGVGSGGWDRRDAARSADAFREMRQAEQAGAADRSRLPPRHCWVLNPPSAPGRWPGLVVQWRSVGGHWEGRVVVVIGRGRDAAVLDVWMREEQLTPV